jgi:alpha-tubulin suppressor-like RCC1 family protein
LQGVPESGSGASVYWLSATAIETNTGVPWEGDRISNGWFDTCALDATDGRIVCYGFNDSGQLGVGEFGNAIRLPDLGRPVADPADTTMPFDPFLGALDVVSSGFAQVTCARKTGSAWCWGMNREGELGDGLIDHGPDCGGATISNYDCSNVPVQVGGSGTPLTDVASIAIGASHACALGATGTLRCWGDNRGGEVAQPPATARFDLPTPVTLSAPVVEMALGGFFTCAMLNDGTVWCWGFNYSGTLGDGMAGHGETCTFGIPEAGMTFTGDCSATPVQVMGIADATHIAAGADHACVIRASGQIWCWGDNARMQVGDPSLERQYAPIQVLDLPSP